MLIGIPKEILEAENRVAATPDTVKKYIALGFDVAVETAAGRGILIDDEEYRQAGAKVYDDAARLYAEADIVLKVKQPILNEKLGRHEAGMLRRDGILITFLHPAAPENHDMVRQLQQNSITALTMDGIPRISRAQRMDALSSMSAVTGYKSVIMAADRLPKFVPMVGTAIGTVKPAQFVVIGTGVVGLQAIATAKRLGGVVKAVDIRQNACTEAETLGAKIVPCDIPQELAVGSGGYAKSLTCEWLDRERRIVPVLREEPGLDPPEASEPPRHTDDPVHEERLEVSDRPERPDEPGPEGVEGVRVLGGEDVCVGQEPVA